jgi:23S rRNA (adenine-N6)-dimethyltransferase
VTGRRARRRAVLAQNLFRSDATARRLVSLAGIRSGDLAYDLGAGTGRVTAALVEAGARVIAVERDPTLATKLAQRFVGRTVQVVSADLLEIAPDPCGHVVANLPFNLTAATLRGLLMGGRAPASITLVLQREAARKWAGQPRATAVSLTLQPWFQLEVATSFSRQDFVPAPACEVAVLRARRRSPPLLRTGERDAWAAYVRYAFARQGPDARRVFRSLLSNLQWRRLSTDLAIPPGVGRGDLSLAQWLGIYRFSTAFAAPRRRRALGAAWSP